MRMNREGRVNSRARISCNRQSLDMHRTKNESDLMEKKSNGMRGREGTRDKERQRGGGRGSEDYEKRGTERRNANRKGRTGRSKTIEGWADRGRRTRTDNPGGRPTCSNKTTRFGRESITVWLEDQVVDEVAAAKLCAYSDGERQALQHPEVSVTGGVRRSSCVA